MMRLVLFDTPFGLAVLASYTAAMAPDFFNDLFHFLVFFFFSPLH